MNYLVLKSAARRIEAIYAYTAEAWGEKRAQKYISGLFACFEAISRNERLWQVIPAKYGVQGYYTRFEKHFVYWRQLPSGKIGITAILHEKMDHLHHLEEDFKP